VVESDFAVSRPAPLGRNLSFKFRCDCATCGTDSHNPFVPFDCCMRVASSAVNVTRLDFLLFPDIFDCCLL
jgi:hypothetical protein